MKNIPKDAIERFREQVQLVDLSGIADVKPLEEAVRACYQEKEAHFKINKNEYKLYDPGFFPKEPFIYRLTDKLRS